MTPGSQGHSGRVAPTETTVAQKPGEFHTSLLGFFLLEAVDCGRLPVPVENRPLSGGPRPPPSGLEQPVACGRGKKFRSRKKPLDSSALQV